MKNLMPFREWCKINGLGVTTGYKLLKEGKIEACKVGKLTMISTAEAERFVNSLPLYPIKNSGA